MSFVINAYKFLTDLSVIHVNIVYKQNALNNFLEYSNAIDL